MRNKTFITVLALFTFFILLFPIAVQANELNLTSYSNTYSKGDVNGDGNVNSLDVTRIIWHIVGKQYYTAWNEKESNAKVTIKSQRALDLQTYAANLI